MIHRQPKLSFYRDEYAISWPWQYNVRVDVWPDNHTVIHHVTRRTQDVTGRHWYTDRYWDTMMTNGGTVIYQWGQFNRAPSSFIKHVVSVEWWSWMHVHNQDAHAVFGMIFVRQTPTTIEMVPLNHDILIECLNKGRLNNSVIVRRIWCVLDMLNVFPWLWVLNYEKILVRQKIYRQTTFAQSKHDTWEYGIGYILVTV